MTESSEMFVVEQQAVRVDDVFSDGDLILDLGGGGEGVIGQLRGRQVVAIDARQDELEECAPGPIKVVANAKSLPFLDQSFDAGTAFFFFMYVPAVERGEVLAEAFRVLKPGGKLHVWDVRIPETGDPMERTFAVFVKAALPDRTIQTGYGVSWAGREMSADSIAQLAEQAGFVLLTSEAPSGETFRLILQRPDA